MSLRTIFRGGTAAAAAIVLASLGACAQPGSPPQEVQKEAPSVTYKYGTDRDLLAASQRARDYCAGYQTVPSMETMLESEADGTKTVTFRCLKAPPAVAAEPPPPAPAPMVQTYRTDSDLLQALVSADRQCARYGQRAASDITTNPDGTKSVTFRCVAG